MSSTIHVEVPTEPMARSVDQLSRHVDGTTGAIIAMKVATIAAEQDAADRVCRNVDNGFLSLIASQISQKSARAKAIVDARLMELVHQKKALLRIHDQMERDYHRIAARYLKLFNSLDLALKSRIYELDKMPTQLVGKEMPRMSSRISAFGGQPFIYQVEGLSSSQMMVASRVRRDTAGALGSMVGIIEKSRVLQETMSGVSDLVKVDSTRPVMLPVVVFDVDDADCGLRSRKSFAPAAANRIQAQIESRFGDLQWGPVGVDEFSGVRSRCAQKLQKSNALDRKKQTAIEILKGLNWQSPKRGAS